MIPVIDALAHTFSEGQQIFAVLLCGFSRAEDERNLSIAEGITLSSAPLQVISVAIKRLEEVDIDALYGERKTENDLHQVKECEDM